MYNRQFRISNHRRNPNTPTVYSGYDPKEPADVTYFKSIAAARAYLLQHSHIDPSAASEELKKKLKDAENLILRADSRNLRRQVKSLAGKGRTPRKQILTPEQILAYGNIASQLARLEIPISRFISWCGVTDSAEKERLCNTLLQILKDKCKDLDLTKWEEEACRHEGYCATGFDDESSDEGEPLPFDEPLEENGAPKGPVTFRKNLGIRNNPVQRGVVKRYRPRRVRRGDVPRESIVSWNDLRAELIEDAEPSSLHRWEEVNGPKGETIRFRVDRYKSADRLNQIKELIRDSSRPRLSDVVLDMTKGCVAYRITRTGREEIPLNKEMEFRYKDSFLYQVRLFAAGRLSSDGFLGKVNEILNVPHTKQKKRKSKKLKKRKK